MLVIYDAYRAGQHDRRVDVSAFWSGYLAGIISLLLPSLVILVVMIQRAPDLTEALD